MYRRPAFPFLFDLWNLCSHLVMTRCLLCQEVRYYLPHATRNVCLFFLFFLVISVALKPLFNSTLPFHFFHQTCTLLAPSVRTTNNDAPSFPRTAPSLSFIPRWTSARHYSAPGFTGHLRFAIALYKCPPPRRSFFFQDVGPVPAPHRNPAFVFDRQSLGATEENGRSPHLPMKLSITATSPRPFFLPAHVPSSCGATRPLINYGRRSFPRLITFLSRSTMDRFLYDER